MTKLILTEKLTDLRTVLEGDLTTVISALEDLMHNYGGSHDNIRLEKDYYGHSSASISLFGDREETDREYKQRTEKESKKKEREKALKEKAERKEYNRLKAKFEKKEKG